LSLDVPDGGLYDKQVEQYLMKFHQTMNYCLHHYKLKETKE